MVPSANRRLWLVFFAVTIKPLFLTHTHLVHGLSFFTCVNLSLHPSLTVTRLHYTSFRLSSPCPCHPLQKRQLLGCKGMSALRLFSAQEFQSGLLLVGRDLAAGPGDAVGKTEGRTLERGVKEATEDRKAERRKTKFGQESA